LSLKYIGIALHFKYIWIVSLVLPHVVFFYELYFDVWNFLPSHLGILVITVSRAVWVLTGWDRHDIWSL